MNYGLHLRPKNITYAQKGRFLRAYRMFPFIPVPPVLPPEFPNSEEYMTDYTVASVAGDYQSGVFAANFAASGGAAYAYSNHPRAWKAFDDVDGINTNTYHNSGGAIHNGLNVYLAQKFPSARLYNRAEIYAMQDATYYYHPRTFDIRASQNGTSWTTLLSVDRGTTGWDTHSKTFDFLDNVTTYQYYGLYCTACGYTAKAGGSAQSVAEVYIHRLIWKAV